MAKDTTTKTKRLIQVLFVLTIILLSTLAIFFLADWILTDERAVKLVGNYGYLGVLIVAFITGLNLFLPVPAGTFTPIFVAGGLSIFLIVPVLIIGTTIADFVSYYIGRMGKSFITDKYPKIYQKVVSLRTNNERLIPWLVFTYASFMPFPNEAFLVPLGILDVRVRTFIIPLLLGTAVHQTLTVLIVSNAFAYFLEII